MFVTRASVKSRDPLTERVDMAGLSNAVTRHKVCFDDVRPKTFNEFETGRHRALYPTDTSASCSQIALYPTDTSGGCSQTALEVVPKLAGKEARS